MKQILKVVAEEAEPFSLRSLLKYWPFILFVLLWFAAIADLRSNSVLSPHVSNELRFGWIYLAGLFVVLYALIFYFHTYKKGYMQKFLDRGVSRFKYFSLVVFSALWIPPLFAYGCYEFGAWGLTYTPVARDKSVQMLVDRTYPIRRGRVMVKGKDMQGNPMVARIARGLARPSENTIATIQCKHAFITCRITNVEVKR